MSKRKPWTPETLLRELRKLLLNEQVTLHFLPLKTITAHISWDSPSPPLNVKIQVDNDKNGKIECVIHELLHLVFHDLSTIVGNELEEAAILAWEGTLYDHVMRSPRRLIGWRNLIDKKLSSQEIPDEEL